MTVGPSYVYIALARTASLSVTRWLVDHHGGEILTPLYHSAEVPAEHQGKLVFSVVRHPYDRVVSLGELMRQKFWPNEQWMAQAQKAGRGQKALTLWEFVQWCANTEELPRYQQYRLSQSAVLQEGRALVGDIRIVRFENLAEGLNALPFVSKPFGPPYHLNSVRRGLLRNQLTANVRLAIQEYCACDFKEFGYQL